MKKKVVFTKDSTLGEVMANCKKAEEILTGFGMHCFYCPMSQQETLEEASEVHGIDLDLLLEMLNKSK
ncbi:MAG: DUF1858 domain-containing protein [Clostridia bacterium]|nr:DUF1858 domain-containing protein [Clostridia bacterium]